MSGPLKVLKRLSEIIYSRLLFLQKKPWIFFFFSFFQKFWLIPNHPKLLKEVRLEPKFFYFSYLFLGMLGLCCCAQAFSSYGMWRLLSRCSAWASHCGSFSCCKARALWCMDLSSCGTWAQWLQNICSVAPWHVESSWARDWTHVCPVLAGRILTIGPPARFQMIFWFNNFLKLFFPS